MNPQVNVAPQVNPLLERVKLPGRIFQIPSAGSFYTNGELGADIESGELHIHPMTALDEITMKNPDMLFSGKAISTVFRHCIPDIQKPEELFAKDIDAIMIFLRAVTYGQFYEIEATHDCENAKHHSYSIDVEEMIGSSKNLSPADVEKMYVTTLSNGQIVKMQPIKYKHVLELLRMNENKTELTLEDQERNVISNLMYVIVQVDEVTDKKMISEWIKAISPQIMSQLAEAIDKSQEWGINTVKEIKCKDCGENFLIDIPINPISFFFD